MNMFRNNEHGHSSKREQAIQQTPRNFKLKSSRIAGNIVSNHNLFLDSYITPDLIEMQRTQRQIRDKCSNSVLRQASPNRLSMDKP
jgi:hypothetical protein